ncbi:hypothetical protein ABZ686_19690 [Streptomyces sp. NPDC006992]|uniref:hypothetical protein n=1 Tax=unclassified Streptomyces TaxID=2593676 RepID=UPI0033CF9990
MSASQDKPLPLPDFDQLPAGAVEHRIRPLSGEDVQRLLDHERAHANRTQVVHFLTARLDELAAGAEPTGGDPQGERPERSDGASGRSPAAPDTAAEPSEPLRHGRHRF